MEMKKFRIDLYQRELHVIVPETNDYSPNVSDYLQVVGVSRGSRAQISVEGKNFVCSQCDRRFSAKRSLVRHQRYECGQKPRFECPYCTFRSKHKWDGTTHVKYRHPDRPIYVLKIDKP
uniref:Lola_15 protein n=1 Tax=Fopius arisanus TaxID=64838 RepID=A0A0C9PUS4_9HYME